MAAAAGLSHQSVHRTWKANDLKPRPQRTFKISNDPQFERKLWDVIGLYLNPPAKALVLCCDEKSQCQALKKWMKRHPRFILHFTPTDSSWMNLVERFFVDLTHSQKVVLR